eukprot:s4772_g4.t1
MGDTLLISFINRNLIMIPAWLWGCSAPNCWVTSCTSRSATRRKGVGFCTSSCNAHAAIVRKPQVQEARPGRPGQASKSWLKMEPKNSQNAEVVNVHDQE